MPYSWMGANLEVDLTRGEVEKVKGEPELVRDYLGGKGLGAKILWDRVPPETKPFSPENLIILATGLLTGTIIPFANRCVMTFLSPVTGLHHYSAMGGFFASELKHAGYDNIVFSGRSPTPVYLCIENDKVALRDASHFWGKGTHETREIIRRELKNDKIQIACIGQAGENRVNCAGVQCGIGASASRGGIGALWGDKKLKAIAIYGTKDVSVANSSRLLELSHQIDERTGLLREARQNIETGARVDSLREGFYGNLEFTPKELPPDSELNKTIAAIDQKAQEWLSQHHARMVGCYNCAIACRRVLQAEKGPTYAKCASFSTFMVSSKTIDYDFALECLYRSEDYGFDVSSMTRYLAFAIDLYQKGILTAEDTDGMRLEWGNRDIALALIEKICHREGIGEILANGVHQAARQIGRGAEEYVQTTKKLEEVNGSYYYRPYSALAHAIGDKVDNSGQMSSTGIGWQSKSRQEKEAYIKGGWFTLPKEYEKYYFTEFNWDGTNYEPLCRFAVHDAESFALTNSLGLCNIAAGYSDYCPVGDRSVVAELVSGATGEDISESGLTEKAQRIINLVRALNLRLGLKRKDDIIAKAYFTFSPAPPRQKLNREVFDQWVGRFYELMGWNSDGIPTKETLRRLGLDNVGQDLQRRGILAGTQDISPVLSR